MPTSRKADTPQVPLRALVPRPGLALPCIAIGYLLGHFVWLFGGWGSARARVVAGDMFFLPTFIGAAVALAWAAAHPALDEKMRRAYRTMAAGYVLGWFGNLCWFYYDIFVPGYASRWFDAFTAAMQLLLIVGLLMVPMTPRAREERAKFWLDVLITLLGASMIGWYLVVRPEPVAMQSSWWETLVHYAFSLGDIVIVVTLGAILLRRPGASSRKALAVLVAGQLTSVFADAAYASLSATHSYVSGAWVDGGWMLADVTIILAAWTQRRTAADHDDRVAAPETVRISMLPYVMGAVCAVLMLYSLYRDDAPALAVLVPGNFVLMLVVLCRQYASVRDNARLMRERIAQELRFRSLVQHSSDVVIVVEADGAIGYRSASAERTLAPTEPGGGFESMLHPEDAPGVVHQLRGLIARAGTPATFQCRVRGHGERWLPLEFVATPMLDDPNVHGIVLNGRDVGERVALEGQLLQAQKMEAVGRLAGGIAHDFNNLMLAITGTSELALETLPSEHAMREDFVEIRRAAERAVGLTRQLLAFSRKQIAQPVVLDVGAALGEVEAMLRRLVTKDVRLTVRVRPGLWRVRLDPGQFEQTIVNLAVNARDAMAESGELGISCANEEIGQAEARRLPGLVPGEYVALRVTDSGCGMDEDLQARIFEPFFTTKPQGKGTGLGLASVYAIVQQAGGHVAVESAPGQGSTFTIYLPRVRSSSPTPALPTPARGPQGTETILVVDDEEPVRTTVRRILQRHGYNVITASNGIDALAVARRHDGPIHLLLTDMVMPEMGGRALIDRFRGEWPSTVIVCMSGYTEDAALRQGLLAEGDAGRETFIAKPFTIQALATMVREALDNPTPLAGAA